jgi:hypothetical protein
MTGRYRLCHKPAEPLLPIRGGGEPNVPEDGRTGGTRMRDAGLVLAVWVLGAVFLPGCVATWHVPKHVDAKRGDVSPVGSISVVVHSRVLEDASEEVPWLRRAPVGEWRGEVIRALQDSGLFFNVQEGLLQADYRAEFEIVEQDEARMWLSLFTVITAGIVPHVASRSFTVRATFASGARAAEAGGYSATGQSRVWSQLLLLPASPLTPSQDQTSKNVVYALARLLVEQAEARNTFGSARESHSPHREKNQDAHVFSGRK